MCVPASIATITAARYNGKTRMTLSNSGTLTQAFVIADHQRGGLPTSRKFSSVVIIVHPSRSVVQALIVSPWSLLWARLNRIQCAPNRWTGRPSRGCGVRPRDYGVGQRCEAIDRSSHLGPPGHRLRSPAGALDARNSADPGAAPHE